MLRFPWTLGENWATFYSNIWSQLSVTWFKAAHHTRLVTLLDRSKLSQEDWNIRKLLHSVRLWEATVRNSRLVSTYLYSQYLGNAKILGSSFTPEVNVVTHFCKKSRFTLNWRSNNKTINSFKIYFCISHFVQVQASEQTFSISLYRGNLDFLPKSFITLITVSRHVLSRWLISLLIHTR